MEDNKDILLNQLFAEAAKTEIADNGFTRKVMRRLPSRAELYNRIWTFACVIVAIFLLTYFKAWNYLLDWAVNVTCVFHNIDWLRLVPVIVLLPTASILVSSVFAYRELKA
ncbi:MAG: DUF5056 domain-containing protein [Prevotella sp.]